MYYLVTWLFSIHLSKLYFGRLELCFFMNIEIDLLECWRLPLRSHYQNQNIYLFISILIFLSSRSILSSRHFFNEDLKPINYNLPQGTRREAAHREVHCAVIWRLVERL